MFNIKYHLLFILSTTFFLGACTTSQPAEFFFTGDGTDLLISEADILSGWTLENAWQEPQPEPDATNQTVIYNTQPDRFGTDSLIFHSVSIFAKNNEATIALDEEYQLSSMLAAQINEIVGLSRNDLEPPQKFNYTSPLADEIKVIYFPARGLDGTIVGYRYEMIARYGNVVSIFNTVVENVEQTGIKAGEANVLPWLEVEKLLKVIDNRIQEAGSQ
ncbi:MAG: hypothetical protein GY797_28880 [Deltaproteobacteria bacterium]|nr:hypothetical protein [Deltaproteobacteria bacterium]